MKGKGNAKLKWLTLLFSAIAIVCFSTSLILGLNFVKRGNQDDKVDISYDQTYFDNIRDNNKFQESFLQFFDYTTASAAPDQKTAGVWCVGIDINSIGMSNIMTVFKDSVISIPSTYNGKSVVGVDFTQAHATNGFYGAISMVKMLEVPKSVKYITSGSFEGFTSLEYIDVPFVGTARESSARGIGYDILDIINYGQSGKIATSDCFGSMFGSSESNNWQVPAGATYPVEVQWQEISSTNAEPGNPLGYPSFYYSVPANLKWVKITDDRQIGNNAFVECPALRIDISSSSSLLLGNYVFSEALVEHVTLPAQNVSFRNGVFNFCQHLKEIIIPEGVRSIPYGTFKQCIDLKEVYIPTSITEIGDGAFADCQSLQRMFVYRDGTNQSLTDDYNYNVENNLVIDCLLTQDDGDPNIYTTHNFPSGLRSIGKNAFSNCSWFKEVSFTNNLESIGTAAFSGCTRIRSMVLPFIGAHRGGCTDSCAPEKDKDLHSNFGFIFGTAALTEGYAYAASQTYYDSKSMSNATQVFYVPGSLVDLTITNETNLALGCLQNLSSIENLTINPEATSIVPGCMNGCSNLESLTISQIIGGNLGVFFQGNVFTGSETTTGNNRVPGSLTTVKITNQATIPTGAFHYCKKLVNVEIGEVTQYIDASIFFENQSLKSLILPFVGYHRGQFSHSWWWWRDEEWRNTLQWIFSSTYSDGTYANNTLRYVDSYIRYIPSSLQSITITDDVDFGTYSFRNFSSVQSISITNVPNWISEYSFYGCSSLKEVQLPYIGQNLNPNSYAGVDHVLGWIFGESSYYNSYVVNQYGRNYYIPSTLTTVKIGDQNRDASLMSRKVFDHAFKDCTSITTVDFYNADITSIGTYAFANCINLSGLKYPNARFSHVSDYAFYRCKKIYSMKDFVPLDSISTIGNYAFAGTSLGYIDGHTYTEENNRLKLDQFTSLGNYAFANCLEIDSVVIPNGISIGEGLFSGCSYLEEVDLINKNVSKYMFQNCVSLEGIDLTGVWNIPEGIFSGCSSLKWPNPQLKAVSPDGLLLDSNYTSIGAYAFRGCKSLTHFDFPVTLKSIDTGAFQSCTGLDYLTIPRETKVINGHGWDGCNSKFFFYVYEPEPWEPTWVDNWNCDYPVYVLGEVGEEVYTYTYDETEKRYYITGLVADARLTGTVILPSTRNGVHVAGVDESRRSTTDIDAGAKNLNTQDEITAIVIPKGITKIVGTPFNTGSRIDIYTEYTKAEITQIYNESYNALNLEFEEWLEAHSNATNEEIYNEQINIFGKLKGWLPYAENSNGVCIAESNPENPWEERQWISGGVLYYADYWQYGTGANTRIPYLKTSTLRYTLNPSFNYQYSGQGLKPAVVQIQLPGEIFINEDLGVDDSIVFINDHFDIFNYMYSNNVSVGTANIELTINNDALRAFNNDLNVYRRNHPLRLIGTTTIHFQIEKIELTIFADANDGFLFEKVYDETPFTYSQWSQQQISGLIEGFPGAIFSGTISTPDADAGYYMGVDLYWSTPWKVMLNNVDISSNFRIYIGFDVEITPQEIEIVWALSNQPINGVYQLADYSRGEVDASGNAIFRYPYIGGAIQPYAIAKKYGTDDEFLPHCNIYATHKDMNHVGIYPYPEVEADKALGFIADTYEVYATIASDSLNNYVLYARDENGDKYEPYVIIGSNQKIRAIDGRYRISKGLINITFDIENYLIDPFATNWSQTWGTNTDTTLGYNTPLNNREYITGLGANSRFVGTLASSGDAKAPYSLKSMTEGHLFDQPATVNKLTWKPLIFNYKFNKDDGSEITIAFTASDSAPFLIYNPILGIADESMFYDVIVDARVKIEYHDFEKTFFIGISDTDYESLKNPNYIIEPDEVINREDKNEVTGETDYRTYYYFVYEVDGNDYKVTVEDLMVIEKKYPDYNVKYYSEDGNYLGDEAPTFRAIGDHVFGVELSAKHYNTVTFNIWINAVKSNVRIDDISKTYDREPINPYAEGKFLKIGTDQISLIQYTYMDAYGTVLNNPPSKVGNYKVHIVIPAGEYFNEFDEIIDFQIYKRVIEIDVTGSKTFDHEIYSYEPESFTLQTTSDNPDKGLLIGDDFTGVIVSNSFVPAVYQTTRLASTQYYLSWSEPSSWQIFDNTIDVSSNYDVRLIGTFEIKPLQFKYEVYDNNNTLIEKDEDGNRTIHVPYDYDLHFIDVVVSYPTIGNFYPADTASYELYYSDIPLPEYATSKNDPTNTLYPTKWSDYCNRFNLPGTYTLYYMLKADYFETIIEYVTLVIDELTIEYEDPATMDDDGNDGFYTVEYTGYDITYEITVTKPEFSATVYYSTDGVHYVPYPLSFKDYGRYKVWYKIEAPNYASIGPIERTVEIVQPGQELSDTDYVIDYFDGRFDNQPHSVDAHFTSAFLNGSNAPEWTEIYYSLDEGETWTTQRPEYTAAGRYRVSVKLCAQGYRDVITHDEIVIRGMDLNLIPTTYKDYFDGEYHNIGLQLTGGVGETLRYDKDQKVYYYDNSLGYGEVPVSIYYVTNVNLLTNQAAWLPGVVEEDGKIRIGGFKDVGKYTVYAILQAENFETKSFSSYTIVEILYLTNPSASMDSPQIFEYSKAPLDESLIKVDTVSDGTRYCLWYAAHLDVDGVTIVPNSPLEKVECPQELGYYYVVIKFTATKNCGQTETSGFIQIVPRTLEVKWDSPQYYTGDVLDPHAYVETGTSDEIHLQYEVKGTQAPREVGTYTFSVWIVEQNNPNYVLDRKEFDMEIKLRNVLFKLDEEHLVKENNAIWTEEDSLNYDKTPQRPGDNAWHLLGDLSGVERKYNPDTNEYYEVEYSGLAQNHIFYVKLRTNQGIRGNYFYSTIKNDFYINAVEVVEYDIYEVDQYKNLVIGIDGKPVSVLDFYEVDFDIMIHLTNPTIDIDSLEITDEFKYDGLAHAIQINLPSSYNNARIRYKTVDGNYVSTPSKYIQVGQYKIEYYISASGFEDTYGEATLKIVKTDLEIEIGDLYKSLDTTKALHEKYDDTYHRNSIKVTNIYASIPSPTHVKYFDANAYTFDEIYDFYSNYDPKSSFLDDALDNEILNAGYYHCVAYFANNDYGWNESFQIETIQLKPRNIRIEFPLNEPNHTQTYNGSPIVLGLGNTVIDTNSYELDGLVPGHKLDVSTAARALYSVQTKSADAGKYDLLTDFEFLSLNVRNSKNQYVLASNYHPEIIGNFQVEIFKAYLKDSDFYIITETLEKIYDGKRHEPEYYCVSDGKILIDYYEIDPVTGYKTYVPGDQKNVGTYYLQINIDEGKNYYSSAVSHAQLDDKGNPYFSHEYLEATITCVPKPVEVLWENEIQTFTGDALTINAYFIDRETDPENEIRVDLLPLYYDSTTFNFENINVYNAGTYLTHAVFNTTTTTGQLYARNYELIRDTTLNNFVIQQMELSIQLGDGGDSNYITYYNSQTSWFSYLYNTPTSGAAEILAPTDELTEWLAGLTISSAIDELNPAGIRTIGNTSGLIYSDIDEFALDLMIRNKQGVDITQSFAFNIIGYVRVKADDIDFEARDVTVPYREVSSSSSVIGYTFAELGCLTVYNPSNYDVSSFQVNGGNPSNEFKPISQAGTYHISFLITSPNHDSKRAEVTVVIEQMPSHMTFKNDLTKTYDGAPVSVSTLIVTSSSGYNGSVDDLVFTYFEYVWNGSSYDVVPLAEAPEEVGLYHVQITSNADLDPDTPKNYTALNVIQKFSIKPRMINLDYYLDYEITNSGVLGTEWKVSNEASSGNINDIVSGDYLNYSFKTDSLERGNHVASQMFTYNSNSANIDKTGFDTDMQRHFGFSWNVIRKDDAGNIIYVEVEDPNSPGDKILIPKDVSKNYSINLKFRLVVHYPYINADIQGVETDYDGDSYHGTLTFAGDKNHDAAWFEANVDQRYSLNPDDVQTSNITSIDDPALTFTEPGTYTVYYYMTVNSATENYEELKGSFVIKINRLVRDVTYEKLDKTYDGIPAGIPLAGTSGITRYLPNYTIHNVIFADNYDIDDIDIIYRTGSVSIDPTVGCINASDYSFIMTIPATTYYEETIIRGKFFIDRIKIYLYNDGILGGLKFPFDGMVKSVEVDENHANYIVETRPVISGVETPTELRDQGLRFETTLVTNGTAVREYKGSDNTLTTLYYEYHVYDGATDTDITDNYLLDIAGASITIENIKFSYIVENPTYVYDGLEHGYSFKITAPSNMALVKVEYFNQATGQFQVQPVLERNCGTYTTQIRISAKNYDTETFEASFTINRAKTEVIYVTALSKVYDGTEVTIPETIFTNRDIANEENLRNTYTYRYYKYNADGTLPSNPMYCQEYKDGEITKTPGTRPIDVGHYAIEIEIPATENFTEGYYFAEFYISELPSKVNWSNLSFTYDGTAKEPRAVLQLSVGDRQSANVNIVLNLLIRPMKAGGDVNHINAGIYQATAEIDYAASTPTTKALNYKIDPTTATAIFNIKVREVTVLIDTVGEDCGEFIDYKFFDRNVKSMDVLGDGEFPFVVNNIVDGHLIRDYLQLTNYAGPKSYRDPLDFTWYSSTGAPKTSPDITDASGNVLTENYTIIYQYNFRLEEDLDGASAGLTIINYDEPYDGKAHSFEILMKNMDNYTFKFKNKKDNVSYPPEHYAPYSQPHYTDVCEEQILIEIYDLDGNKVTERWASITITATDPELKLLDEAFVTDKEYDGIPFVNPEVTYNGSTESIPGLKYEYYIVNPDGSETKINYNPVNVGNYKLKISTEDSKNFLGAKLEYAITIHPREITISIPPSTKPFDGVPWEYTVTDKNVENSETRLPAGHTLRSQVLQMFVLNPGVYSYDVNTYHWYEGVFHVYDADGNDVASNFDVTIVSQVTITNRIFIVEFPSKAVLLSEMPANGVTSIAKVTGTVSADGSSVDNLIYVNRDDIEITYSETYNGNYVSDPIYKMTEGLHTIYARIVDKNGIYGTLIRTATIYIHSDSDDEEDKPLGEPTDVDDEGENAWLTYEHNKVYDGIAFSEENGDIIYVGPAEYTNRHVDYYSYEDYVAHKDDLSQATKLTNPPVNAGAYVFVYTIAEPGMAPVKEYHQSFRIYRKPVDVVWEGLVQKYTGSSLVPVASYIDVKGNEITCDVERPYTEPGSYIVIASTTDPNYKLASKKTETFYIVTDDVTPTPPNDAVGDPDVQWGGLEKEYDGKPYPLPACTEIKYTGPSKGAQSVVYYTLDYYSKNKDNLDPSQAISAPIDAGKYVFVLTVEEDPTNPTQYPKKVYNQGFTITPKKVDVTWENTSLVYNGSPQGPKATYVDINGNTVECTVNNKQYGPGSFKAFATTEDTNYSLNNPTSTYSIQHSQLTDIVIKDTTFGFGDPLVFEDPVNNKFYIVKSDYEKNKDLVTDINNTYLVDDNGVLFYWDEESKEWVDAKLPYIMEIDANRDAGTHDINIKLTNPDQFSWATHGKDDLHYEYEINKLVFPNDKYELLYDYIQTWPYDNGKPIEPNVTIYLRDIETLEKTKLQASDYTLDYRDNCEPTTDENKAKIIITGAGNYSFNETKEFNITYDPSVLEIKDGMKIRWITAEINADNIVEVKGEKDDEDPVKHEEAGELNLYLGYLHQNTPIKNVIEQFKNYDETPERMVVKRPATADELADTTIDKDEDGYVIVTSDFYETTMFGTGYKVCLYDKDPSDTTGNPAQIVDSVQGIVFGDTDGDGLITASDSVKISNFLKLSQSYKDFTQICYFYACLTDRDNGMITASNAVAISNYLKLGIDFNTFGGIY